MFPSEEMECIVCLCEYTRVDHIPRVLHCNHTFCAPCIDKMSLQEGPVHTVCCPICRWTTCVRASVTLPGSLWINTAIWDQLSTEDFDYLEDTKMKSRSTTNLQSRQTGFKEAFKNLRQVFKSRARKAQTDDC